MLVALCKSQDQPCKWDLINAGKPIFHGETILERCVWWFNAAKKYCSPLTLMLILGAVLSHWSQDCLGTNDFHALLVCMHHIDWFWMAGHGPGPEVELAKVLYRGIYSWSDKPSSLNQLAEGIRGLKPAAYLGPDDARKPGSAAGRAKHLNLILGDAEDCIFSGQVIKFA